MQGSSRRIVQQLGVAFAAWTVVALVAYARVPLQALAAGRAMPPLRGSLEPLVGCWIWALLTPPILWVAQRWPLDRRNRARSGLVHLGGALASVALSAPPTYALLVLLDVPGRPKSLVAQTIAETFIDIFAYAALVALGHALAYYRLSAEERVRRSELEARLLTARMEALEARMHPHFLFNALNTVSSLVRTGDSRAWRGSTAIVTGWR